ncbi:MAG: hypothetical protein AB1898_11040 [Acidobacteriota bacterium]
MLAAKPEVDQCRDQQASLLVAQDDNDVVLGRKTTGTDLYQRPTGKTGQLRLLLVDADVRVWESVFQVLQSDLGEFICEVSIDGLENVLLSHSPFDVILIDVYSPVEKFLELPPLIRAVAPRTKVVFISRLFDQALRRRSLQSGAYDCCPSRWTKMSSGKLFSMPVLKTGSPGRFSADENTQQFLTVVRKDK